MKRFLPILLAFLLLTTSGCVYFNVFYNAKRRFLEAEKQRLKAEENPTDRNAKRVAEDAYFLAISKASAVIDLHPSSKWVDDSLMMIGKAEYWREHYVEALRKFAELQSNFPKSVLLEESRLWEGKAYWKMGRIPEAQRVLRTLAREGRSGHADQAAYTLLGVGAEQKAYPGVVSDGEELLGRLRSGILKPAIHQKVGEAHVALRNYPAAEEAFRNALKSSPTPRQEFDADVALGSILENRGEFGKARDLYARMMKKKPLRSRFEADIRLSYASVLLRLGQGAEAFRLCKALTEAFPKTPQASVAYYRMGLAAQREHRKPEEVKEFFRKAQQENRDSPAFDLARQRLDDLDALDRYREKIAADSTGTRALDTVFDLAELYRLRLEEPDSALAAYQRVAARDTTLALAPKAAFAMGWIHAEMKQDSALAREAFARVVRDYPGTPYAEAAAARLGGGASFNDAPRALYQQAEDLRFSGAAPTAYIPILEQIAATYPGNVYAGRALYTLAWTLENAVGDARAARRRYEEVAEGYPQIDLGGLAKKKVGAMIAEVRDDSLRLAARADSLRIAARADSLRNAAHGDSLREAARADSLRPGASGGPVPPAADSTRSAATDTTGPADTPPEVVQTAPLVYPDSLKQYPTESTVYLNVLVGTDGRVKEAVATRGPERYFEAAIATVKQYTFRPGTRAGQPADVWMEQVVTFLPP